ncbi:MAG: hypothetical protein JSS27_18105 [Planctomycetes bacterium]|nr:hypothetical protein [Planctomycetota bacterium]
MSAANSPALKGRLERTIINRGVQELAQRLQMIEMQRELDTLRATVTSLLQYVDRAEHAAAMRITEINPPTSTWLKLAQVSGKPANLSEPMDRPW